jgi:hypothetical protein
MVDPALSQTTYWLPGRLLQVRRVTCFNPEKLRKRTLSAWAVVPTRFTPARFVVNYEAYHSECKDH